MDDSDCHTPTLVRTAHADRGAWLLVPRTSMSSLLFAAIVRDTRGARVRPEERCNCFPASPLCVVTWVFEGQLHLVDEAGKLDPVPLPRMFVTGPYRRSMVSWSPGPIFAMSLGVYPDAWRTLTGVDAASMIDRSESLESVLRAELLDPFRVVLEFGDCRDGLSSLQDLLEPEWRKVRPKGHLVPPRLEGWTRGLAARAAIWGLGKSERQVQRRIKSWTGQTLRDLRSHARAESLFAQSCASGPDASLAEIATEMGYADQSHMGREVRRMTGESPARINRLIQTDERYWCYRLLGKRFEAIGAAKG